MYNIHYKNSYLFMLVLLSEMTVRIIYFFSFFFFLFLILLLLSFSSIEPQPGNCVGVLKISTV